jgi:hypothetical protein
MRTREERELASSIAFVLGFAVSITLGYWGWSRVHNFQDPTETAHFLGRAYLTLQLFVLHPQDLPSEVPWQLQAAMFMAPAVLALATVTLITARFRKRLRHMWFRRSRGHAIVCGAGVHGMRLAENLAQNGRRVVVVDIDERAPGMRGPEHRHEYRLVADTVHEDTLASAGVRRAERLIAVAGDDVVNSQIASTVRSLAEEKRVNPRLRVLVQAEDATLARFIEDWQMRDGQGPGAAPAADRPAAPAPARLPKIEIFGANAIAAAALFGGGAVGGMGKENDNAILADLEHCEEPHLLLAGDHPLLEAIMVASLRRGRARRLRESSAESAATPQALRITIIGTCAESRIAAIVQRWHPEPTIVELVPADVDLRDEPSIFTSRWLHEWHKATQALVACEDELESIAFAVALSRALGKGVKLARVRTQPRNELDKQLHAHTFGSAHLATISVYSIADLAWGEAPDRIDDVAPPRRLAAALRAEGVDRKDANEVTKHVLAQHWLGAHSDPAPRVTPTSAGLVGGLLRAASNGTRAFVSVSAMVAAGVTVDLDSRDNVERAAKQLAAENSDDAFAAWCEYARRTPDTLTAGTDLLALARTVATCGAPLRLKATTLGAASALDGLEPDSEVVERIRSLASPRIAILAGGAASMSGETERAASGLLERALHRYEGLVLTGGSDVGLCGVVRAAASANCVPVLGYAPTGRGLAGSWLRSTREGEFSEAEPVAMWTDLLAAGRKAADIRVVVFPGGAITTAEILLARALGAAVAWLDPEEELPDVLDDTLPSGAEGVIELPVDPMTLRAFLAWPNAPLDPALRETAARELHKQYREEHRKHKRADDPALAPWERLLPTLQRSNLRVVDDIPNKLHVIGKRLVKGGSRLVLAGDEIELLAEMEHGRFNYERLSAGWEFGRARHVSRLISPYLTPWSELEESVKQWDRDAVGAIDCALSKAGWGVAAE